MARGLPHGIRMMRQLRWRELLAFRRPRWRDVAPGRAGRVALGIAAPLLIGASTGHVTEGIFVALGALPAGLVSFQGVNRSRMEAVLVASLGIAVSTFVGATMAGSWPLRVLLVTLWAYLTGLSVSLGSRWSVVCINWTVALLLGEAIPLPPGPAAIRGGLALVGGLLQGGLVALSWTLRPGGEERKALSASYATLASYASAIASGQLEAPSTTALPAADMLQDANPLIPREVLGMYVDLLEEAVRLRASLAAVASNAHQGTKSEDIARFTAEVGTALDRIAAGLSARPGERAKWTEDAQRVIARLSVPRDAGWRWAGEALLGQLRAVMRILARIEATPRPSLARDSRVDPNLTRPPGWLGGALITLRTNATFTTEAGRHALRLAVAAGLAELVSDLAGYTYGRWVVLTVLLVLKPDYASTVARGVQRAVGTVVGAGLVVGLGHVMHPSWVELSLLAVVAIALAHATFDTSYLLFSFFLTVFILLMLQLLGLGALALAEDRIGATVLGAAWALVVFVVWPTWVGTSASEKFAVLIDRDGAYLVSMLQQLAHPERVDLERLGREQDAARRARSDAEAAAERLFREPPHPPLTADLVHSLMAVSARLALGLLAVQTLLEDRGGDSTQGATPAGLDALTAGFQTAFKELAATMRAGSPLEPRPPLRALQRALEEEGRSGPSTLVVTDALVDSVETLGALLGASQNPAGSVAPANA